MPTHDLHSFEVDGYEWREMYVQVQGNGGVCEATVTLPSDCKRIAALRLVGYRTDGFLDFDATMDHSKRRFVHAVALDVKQLPPSDLITNLPHHDRIFAVLEAHRGQVEFNVDDNETRMLYDSCCGLTTQYFSPQTISQLTFKLYPLVNLRSAGQNNSHVNRNTLQQANFDWGVDNPAYAQLWLRVLVQRS